MVYTTILIVGALLSALLIPCYEGVPLHHRMNRDESLRERLMHNLTSEERGDILDLLMGKFGGEMESTIYKYKITSTSPDQRPAHLAEYVKLGLNRWDTEEMRDWISERGCSTRATFIATEGDDYDVAVSFEERKFHTRGSEDLTYYSEKKKKIYVNDGDYELTRTLIINALAQGAGRFLGLSCSHGHHDIMNCEGGLAQKRANPLTASQADRENFLRARNCITDS